MHDFCAFMTIISIETSTSVCSAAVSVNGNTQLSRINREGANHAKMLPIYIKELLDEVAARGWHIDAVALSEGPGSYTGLRIGTSTAKGLCYGLNVPLIPIPTTEVLCANVKKNLSPFTFYLSPLIDARRMEVYTALYDADIHPLTPIQALVLNNKENLLTSDFQLSTLFFGDGAEKARPILESDTWHFVRDIVPDATYMGALAEQKYNEPTTRKTAQELAYYEPFYLKDFIAAPSHVKGLN